MATLVEAGLEFTFKLDSINTFVNSLSEATDRMTDAAEAGESVGSVFVKLSGQMSGIPVILEKITEEASNGLGLNNLSGTIDRVIGSIDRLTNEAQQLVQKFETITNTPFKLNLELPNLDEIQKALTANNLFEVLNEEFTKTAKLIESTGLAPKIEAIATSIKNAGSGNVLAKSLDSIATAIERFTKIPDFGKLSPRISSFITNIEKLSTVANAGSTVGLESLAAAIPKLVNAFRSLAQTKNIDEFVVRIQKIIPLFDALGKVSISGNFIQDLPEFSKGLEHLFNTFKEFTSGKAIEKLPNVLGALTAGLTKLTTLIGGLDSTGLTKFLETLDSLSKTFRNFGLAVKNFSANGVGLTNMVLQIKQFAKDLDEGINITNFVPAITAIADSLAKLARAMTSFTRSKNVADVKQRFEDLRVGLVSLATLPLDKISKDLAQLTTPLRDLAEVMRGLANAKGIEKFGEQIRLLNLGISGSHGPFSTFAKLLSTLSPVFTPVTNAIKIFGSELLKLPLKFVIANFNIFKAVFIDLPINAVTGTFRIIVGIFETFANVVRVAAQALFALISPILKIITLGGALTQVFSFFGGGKTNQELAQLNQSFKQTQSTMAATGAEASQTASDFNQFDAAANKIKTTINPITATLKGIAGGLTVAGVAAGALNAAKIILFGNSILSLTKRILALGVAVKTLQVAGTVLGNVFNAARFGLQNVLGSAIQATIEFEKLKLSVESMGAAELVAAKKFGSINEALPTAKANADSLIASLQTLAIQSPFSIADVQQGFTLAQSYGLAGDEALKLTTRIVDYVTATGQSGDKIEQIARAAGQISATGKLTAQDLNQLVAANINLRAELSKMSGLKIPELMEKISAGGVSSEIALQALNNVLDTQAGAAARAGESVGGLINSLLDLKDAVLRQSFAGLFEALKPFAASLANALNTDEIKNQLIGVSNTIRDATLGIIDALAKPIGLVVAAFNSIPAPVKAAAADILKFLAVMGGATVVFTLLNAALLVAGTAFALFVNPIGLAAGALLGIIILINKNLETFQALGNTVLTFLTPAFETLQGILENFALSAANVALRFADFVGLISTSITSIDFGNIFSRFEPVANQLLTAVGTIAEGFATGFNNIITIASDAVNNLSDFFGTSLSDITSWGSGLISAFADGILSTLSIVADALQQLGEVIAYWLAPGSPPRIVPDIDKWGESTAQQFLDGFGEADFSTIDDFSSTFEKLLKTTNIDTSGLDLTEVATSFANALASLKNTGTIDTSFVDQITEQTGLASEQVVGLVDKYVGVETATKKAADATTAYEKAVAGLNDELSGIEAAQEFENENKRLTQLRKNLNNRNLSESQRAATLREIDKITKTQQIRNLKQQKEAADKNLDSQKESLATEKARIDLANKFQDKDAGKASSTKGLKDQADSLKKVKDESEKVAEAEFKRQLAMADTAGKIELYKQKLATLTEGSKEYIDVQTKIIELEKQLAKEQDAAAKKAAKAAKGGPLQLLDDLQAGVTPIANVTETLNAPFEKFKTTIDEAKKKYNEFADNIKKRFGEIKKKFEDLGFTTERLKNIAIGLGVAIAGIVLGPGIITILGALTALAGPFVLLAAGITAVVLGLRFFQNGFNLDKTVGEVTAVKDALLGFADIGKNLTTGFFSGDNLIEAILGFKGDSLSNVAKTLGAIGGGIVQLFIAFQKNLVESVGRIALGANPIDAILTSFLNVDYTGTGAALFAGVKAFVSGFVDKIVNLPNEFKAQLSKTNGGISGIFQAALETAIRFLTSNPLVDVIGKFFTFDLSKIKINIGGVELSGGPELGKKLADLFNKTFNTDSFSFLKGIDFSTPLSAITTAFELVKQQVLPIIESIKTTLLSFIPPEVKATLDLIGKAFGVLGLAVEQFKKNFVTQETSAALTELGKAALFAGTQFLKLTGFVIGGLGAIVSLLGVGILPELPRIITNLSHALTAIFNFIGESIQKVIDFILKGNFTFDSFVGLVISLFGDLRGTIISVREAFSNLSGLIGDAIRNVIRFAGVKFGFDAEAAIQQFQGIINIVSKVGDILLLVFGGVLIKSLFTAAKNVSLLRFAFKPVITAAKLLASPITILITIFRRLFISYRTFGTAIRLIKREQGGFLKNTKSIMQLIKALIGILFKGQRGFGELAKPIAKTAEAAAEAAVKGKGFLGFLKSILSFAFKVSKPLALVGTLLAGLVLFDGSGIGEAIAGVVESLTGIDLSSFTAIFGKNKLGIVLVGIFNSAFSFLGPQLIPMLISTFRKINISIVGTVLKNVFSKLDLSTIFDIFTTFPGFLKKIFNPSIFSWLIGLFTKSFGFIAGLFTPVITAIGEFGASFAGLVPLLTNPITLIIGAIGLLALAWYNNWFNIREITASVIDWIVTNVPPMAEAVVAWLLEAAAKAGTYIGNLVLVIISNLAGIGKSIISATSEFATFALQWISTALTNLPAQVQSLTTALVQNLILGAIGILAFGAVALFNFFQWIPGAVAAIPQKLSELFAGLSNWFTNTLMPLFSGQGPSIITVFFGSIINAATSTISLLNAIGTAIINGIIAGINLAMADPRVSSVLQPMIDSFAAFVSGPGGILPLFNSIYTSFLTLVANIASVVFVNPFAQIKAFISGDQGIITTVAGIFAGFQKLVTDLTGIILPNPFAPLALFIEGDDGLVAKISALLAQFTTFTDGLLALTIPNPFAELAAVISGDKSIYQAVVDLGAQFTAFTTGLSALTVPNPFTILTDVLVGDNSLLNLVANLGTQFQTFVQTLTGIVLPNPFTILQAVFAGEGGLPSAITAFSTQITTFVASLDAILIPNVLLPIQVGLEALKTLFPGFTTEISGLQSFINGLTFTNIFQGLTDAMSNITTLVQPIIDKFTELGTFFTTFEFPNPFASLADFEIPGPVKAALKLAGLDAGEDTGTELAKGATETAATELTNANIPITISSTSLASANTEGQALGKNVADGVAQGAQTAAEDPGFFSGVQQSVTNTWNSIWGSHSPSTVADTTMGQPIGEGILQGINTAFNAASPTFVTTLTTFFTNLITLTEQYHKDSLKAFEEFYDDLLQQLDDFIADFIKKITDMVNRFLAQIKRLARETLAILTQFLSDVTSKMAKFAEIMETAAQKGVDAFVDYINENFVNRVTTALDAAFAAIATNEDLLKTVSDGGVKIGEAFVKGIIDGFKNQEGALTQAVIDLVNGLMKTAETTAGIASPSKEAANRIGSPLGHGILQGFLSTKDSLLSGVSGVMGAVLNTNYADSIGGFAKSQITDPFMNALNGLSGIDIAQNVNLKYNGMINSLPNLLQNAAISSNSSLQQIGQMRQLQQTVMGGNTFSPNSYVNSRNEKHYHMHLTTTPERAVKVQRNFRVAEHLGMAQ